MNISVEAKCQDKKRVELHGVGGVNTPTQDFSVCSASLESMIES